MCGVPRCTRYTVAVAALFLSIEPAFAGSDLLLAPLEVWLFIGLVAFIPLQKLILGIVVTFGGAFIPNISNYSKSQTGSVIVDVPKAAKINVKGAPRYAVLAIGILIVISALWDGISGRFLQ